MAGKKGIDPDDLAIRLIRIRTKAVLWGSPGVLHYLNQFSKMEGLPLLEMMRVLDGLQREMRIDLGLSNFGLAQDFFIDLILNEKDGLAQLYAPQNGK